MFDIRIMVLNITTNKDEKPTQYNTFWDNGKLEGIQSNLKIVYRIEGSESEGEE